MKKITAIILVTLACAMMLSSCALVTPNPLDLADKYDKAGYKVSMSTDNDNIIENYFWSTLTSFYKLPAASTQDIELGINAEDVDQIIYVKSSDAKNPSIGFIFYCTANKTAKSVETALQTIKANENISETLDELIIVRQGKLVFFGHDACWDADPNVEDPSTIWN